MNKIIIIGRLTKENEISKSQSGVQILKNSVAVDRKMKEKDGTRKTDFFNITIIGKSVETFDRYTKKGSKLFLSGEMQQNRYKDKNGEDKTSYSVFVTEFEFLDHKEEKKEEEPTPSHPSRLAPKDETDSYSEEVKDDSLKGLDTFILDDDLPFMQ